MSMASEEYRGMPCRVRRRWCYENCFRKRRWIWGLERSLAGSPFVRSARLLRSQRGRKDDVDAVCPVRSVRVLAGTTAVSAAGPRGPSRRIGRVDQSERAFPRLAPRRRPRRERRGEDDPRSGRRHAPGRAPAEGPVVQYRRGHFPQRVRGGPSRNAGTRRARRYRSGRDALQLERRSRSRVAHRRHSRTGTFTQRPVRSRVGRGPHRAAFGTPQQAHRRNRRSLCRHGPVCAAGVDAESNGPGNRPARRRKERGPVSFEDD